MSSSSSVQRRAFLLALAVLAGLDAQQLLAVVPLVERLGLVEPLVALQADEPGAGELGHRLGQLRLARPGRPLDQHRLGQPVGQVDDAADGLVGQVAHLGQAAPHRVQGLEPGRTAFGQPQRRAVARPSLTGAPARHRARPTSTSSAPSLPSVHGHAASGWRCPPRRPSPSSSPSTNRVDAFTSTAAPSTSATKRSATATSEVTIASEWPELYRGDVLDGLAHVVDHADRHHRPQELGGEVALQRPARRRARGPAPARRPGSRPRPLPARPPAGAGTRPPRPRAPGSSRPRCRPRSGASWR